MFRVGGYVVRKKEYVTNEWKNIFKNNNPRRVISIDEGSIIVDGSETVWAQNRFLLAKGMKFMDALNG